MKRKQKTLVILTPGFPASEEDSTCLPLQQSLTRAIHEHFPGVEIVVISFQYPYHQQVYSCAGATVHAFGNKNRGHIFKLLLRRKILHRLEHIKEEAELIGVMSLWYGECAAVGNIFCSKNFIKHYCWLLGQDARKGNKYPARIKLPQEQLIAVSDFIRKEFTSNYFLRPSSVIPPGIELKNYLFPAKQRDIDILGVGSLIPLKQFGIFLEMVAGMKFQFPKLRCIIIGEGPLKEKLQDRILELELQSTVFLLGELSHAKVLECMSRTKVLLHTSSYEGFSGVCMEALASGAFVLSFTRAMNYEIEQWYIATNKKVMLMKLAALLQVEERKQVNDFPIEFTAWKIMDLFGEHPLSLKRSLQVSETE